MRKGLVVTLGVVALILAVSPGFAVAPIISCIPDITISDVEQNGATQDNNFFVFTDALDLDEYVTDADTSPSLLRWSFIESSPGDSIEINGIGTNVTGNVRDPGVYNIRTVSNMATFRNAAWDGTVGTTATMDSTIEMYVSDGVDTDSQTVIVTTVNDSTEDYTDGPGDGITAQSQKSYTFDSGAENWEWYPFGALTEPTHSSSGGSLTATKAAGATLPVYGTWETPKDPLTGVRVKPGCVLRIRYAMTSSAEDETCPGFRMRAVWAQVMYADPPGLWVNDFFSQDFAAFVMNEYKTFDLASFYVADREPGSAGQTYTMLYYPQQTVSLLDTDTVVYVTWEMLDDDSFGDDAGSLNMEQVDIDGFDRPEPDAAKEVAGLSVTDFTSWSEDIKSIGAGSITGVAINQTASGCSLVCTTGDSFFDASAVTAPADAVQLVPGRYYRATFTMTSTATPAGPAHPTVRAGFVSTKFVFAHSKELKGGGLYSAWSTDPEAYETWIVAPSEDVAASNLTEPMQLRLETYATANADPISGKLTAGTVTCTEVVTEEWTEAELAPVAP